MRTYTDKMICLTCGDTMIVDDIDYSFKGCQDEYYICNNCKTTAYVKVRYGKVCKQVFTNADGERINMRGKKNDK